LNAAIIPLSLLLAGCAGGVPGHPLSLDLGRSATDLSAAPPDGRTAVEPTDLAVVAPSDLAPPVDDLAVAPALDLAPPACRSFGVNCAVNGDCCAGLVCNGFVGQCNLCGPYGEWCVRDSDCCAGLRCYAPGMCMM
jgi:hypothetical protein